MKFSLKILFGVLTCCALIALAIKERQTLERNEKLIEDLETQAQSFDPTVPMDLTFLQTSKECKNEFKETFDSICEQFEKANIEFAQSAVEESPKLPAVMHVHATYRHWQRFMIYVPQEMKMSLHIFVTKDPFKGRLYNSLENSRFQLSKNVELKLPAGFSQLELTPMSGTSGENTPWEFSLNDEKLCTVSSESASFSYRSYVWLMSKQKFLMGHHYVTRRTSYRFEKMERYLQFAAFESHGRVEKFKVTGSPGANDYLICALQVQE